MKILIIIPAYNEEKSIKKVMDSIIDTHYDYIIINDGSTDRTQQVIEQYNYNCINLFSNLGIGGAVQTGYKFAYENGYDVAIQFDADGQHDVNYLQKLIEPIKNGEADLVIGSCFLDKNAKNQRSSKIRRLGIRFLSIAIKIFSGTRIYDPTSGFRAVNRKVMKRFADNYPPEYPEPISNYELLTTSNFIIKEVPVKMNKRVAGQSSIHSWKNIYASINVFLSIAILSIRKKKHD